MSLRLEVFDLSMQTPRSP